MVIINILAKHRHIFFFLLLACLWSTGNATSHSQPTEPIAQSEEFVFDHQGYEVTEAFIVGQAELPIALRQARRQAKQLWRMLKSKLGHSLLIRDCRNKIPLLGMPSLTADPRERTSEEWFRLIPEDFGRLQAVSMFVLQAERDTSPFYIKEEFQKLYAKLRRIMVYMEDIALATNQQLAYSSSLDIVPDQYKNLGSLALTDRRNCVIVGSLLRLLSDFRLYYDNPLN